MVIYVLTQSPRVDGEINDKNVDTYFKLGKLRRGGLDSGEGGNNQGLGSLTAWFSYSAALGRALSARGPGSATARGSKLGGNKTGTVAARPGLSNRR
jgi:hypothetical protein